MIEGDAKAVTEGGLLGGKIRYRQLASGHRSGFEPVLLAASIPARSGDQVLEAGCGAGAALLCLGHRVPGISGLGVDIEPKLAALANENFEINALGNISSVRVDIERANFEPVFDHVMANPPWHGQHSTRSSDPLRDLAHHANPMLLATWIEKLARCLKPQGSLTLILPAAAYAEASGCLRRHGCGALALFPFWPRAGQPAKLIIIGARKGARGPDRVLPGLVLHDDGGISQLAQRILRDGDAIDLAG